MTKFLTSLAAATLLSVAAMSAASAEMMSHKYQFTVTNTSDSELIAPVLVASTKYDKAIFDGGYVTKEAEVQVLTGDPAMLKEVIASERILRTRRDYRQWHRLATTWCDRSSCE